MLEPPPVAEMTALLLVRHVAIRTAAAQMAGMLVVAVWAACAAAEQVHASSAVQVAAMREVVMVVMVAMVVNLFRWPNGWPVRWPRAAAGWFRWCS